MIDEASVTHVTGTAFWVAHFRAKESQRAAPAFQRINRPYPLDLSFGFVLRALPKAMSQKNTVLKRRGIDAKRCTPFG